MKTIKLFIAVTLDGFIARTDGSLDWLLNIPNPTGTDHGYNAFIHDIDIIIMGRKTYDDILGFDIAWPYPNQKTYVISRNKQMTISTENTVLLDDISGQSIEQLKMESQKSIWLVGGGQLITQCLNLDAIDEMTISIIPIILGQGIRLFPDVPKETKLELLETQSFENGVVNLVYRRIQ